MREGAASGTRHSAYRGAVFAVALLPIVFGALVACGGFLGLRGALSRERGAGVRTAATLRGDESFRVANRVAAVPTLAGGAVGVLTGIAGLLIPSTAGMITVTVLGLLGVFVLVAAGGVLGHRAAEHVAEPAAAGPCASCDTVACLRGAAAACGTG